MHYSFVDYFMDPVLRGSTIGSMLMCMAAALMGVIIFFRKQSLIGESLSHAAYPGVLLGVIAIGSLGWEDLSEQMGVWLVLTGAFFSSLAGVGAIHVLTRYLNIRHDSALCFVLSSFFGIGLTLASDIQFSFTSLYRCAQTYLYGQTACMTDSHIVIYGILSILIGGGIIVFYKELQLLVFDFQYARGLGVPTKTLEALIFILVAFSIVIGIRSVGVVLMSAMLITPVVAARQYTHKLYNVFILAAIFGGLSGFLGNVLSIEMTYFSSLDNFYFSWPTGPVIVLVSSAICIFSLMCAPERGLLTRFVRIARFRFRCVCENLLKTIWRKGSGARVSFQEISDYQSISRPYLCFFLWHLKRQGWLSKEDRFYYLTTEGGIWAGRIDRLHRLWEAYLTRYIGLGEERIHCSAEEMEHIITPQLEKELTLLLEDPRSMSGGSCEPV